MQPDGAADFRLYDRVVCAARHGAAPLGARGTVTAAHPAPAGAANTVRLSDRLNAERVYQVLFDRPFAGALPELGFDQPRFYRYLSHYSFQVYANIEVQFGCRR